jgi:hypothetical protein
MSDLEDRGYLDESRGNTDPYLEGKSCVCRRALRITTKLLLDHAIPQCDPAVDIMKNVNKTDEYGELTEKQIQDARKRRARWAADVLIHLCAMWSGRPITAAA